MLTRTTNGLKYIRNVPARSGGTVAVEARSLTDEHLSWWHRKIQPVIRQDDSRADQKWRWPLIIKTIVRPLGVVQGPLALAVGVTKPNSNQFVPVVMMAGVLQYPALDEHSQQSVFIWYLSDAPKQALAQHLAPELTPRPKASLMLDLASTLSFNTFSQGRIGLHADPKGGDGLCDWYERQGLIRLEAARPLPNLIRRVGGNDGRYFYHTPESALEASQKFDGWR